VRDRRIVRVVHFGNDAYGSGGIASVIRGHLSQGSASFLVRAVATYGGKDSLVRAALRWLGAVRSAVALPLDEVAHVHISQGGSILREGAIVALLFARRRNIVVTLHGSSLFRPRLLDAVILTVLLKMPSVVHAFSGVYHDRFGVAPEKRVVIPNSVAIPPSVMPVALRDNVLLFAGVVGPRKGADVLMAAWALISAEVRAGWTLVVAGPVEPDAAEFRFDSGDQTVSRVGDLAHGDLLKLMRSARVVVQPSRAEAFPVTVCEGLAAGCAVVGTAVGAMGDLLGRSGQSVVSLSSAVLASELERLMTSPVLLQEMQDKGRAYAVAALAEEAVAPQWLAVYTSLLRTGRLGRAKSGPTLLHTAESGGERCVAT
jgi:glycosyltransferase involved in cell wall biosynthesis